MSFRTLKFNNRCKLSTRLNYLICTKEDETKILLDEISLIIIESQQVCITSSLISELVDHGIRIIFCDEKHQPIAEVQPYYGSNDSYKKIKKQVSWDDDTKDRVWSVIIKQKIHNQALVLRMVNSDAYKQLDTYAEEVKIGDKENREGLAAKSYFAALFGPLFDRRKSSDINTYLDYGYSILLAMVNRYIASYGYLTQLGIHHIGENNPYNLGCDLMEPLRPIIDSFIILQDLNKENFKHMIINSFNSEIRCDSRNMILENAIQNYVLSVLDALNRSDENLIDEITFKDEQF